MIIWFEASTKLYLLESYKAGVYWKHDSHRTCSGYIRTVFYLHPPNLPFKLELLFLKSCSGNQAQMGELLTLNLTGRKCLRSFGLHDLQYFTCGQM